MLGFSAAIRSPCCVRFILVFISTWEISVEAVVVVSANLGSLALLIKKEGCVSRKNNFEAGMLSQERGH